MPESYTVTGTLTDNHTVALDQELPLTNAKVRLIVEPLVPTAPHSHSGAIALIRARQGERGHQPASLEDIHTYLQDERDSWEE